MINNIFYLLAIKSDREKQLLLQPVAMRQQGRQEQLQQTIPSRILQFFKSAIGAAINKYDKQSNKN